MEKKNKQVKIDRSKENYHTENKDFDAQDPSGSYTGKPSKAISETPVQDADDL